MRTITLKISESYFDRFMSFLELLPRKAVRIEESKKQKELDMLKNDLKDAFEDVRLNRTITTDKTIKLKS
jgi:hypothetical protein